MADTNINPLGTSLKSSIEALKPTNYPLIYLSFTIMTILHIAIRHLISSTNHYYYEKFINMNFKTLFTHTNNYSDLSTIGLAFEKHIYFYALLGLITVLFWSFFVNYSYNNFKSLIESTKYTLIKSSIKLVSLLFFFMFTIFAGLNLFSWSGVGLGMVQMLIMMSVVMVPYYLIIISIPKAEVSRKMNFRFYFNLVTIFLLLYLLKAPLDSSVDYLFNMDLKLEVSESKLLENSYFIYSIYILEVLFFNFLCLFSAIWSGKLAKHSI